MSDQNYYFKQSGDMIDISSTTGGKNPDPYSKKRPQPVKSYGGGVSKALGVIIKIISFVVAFGCVAIGGVGCLLIQRLLSGFFDSIAIALFIFSVVIGTISLFIIYGIGQIICQNNEILSRMNDDQ